MGADIVIQCSSFETALDSYTGELGFRIDLIYPADSPRVAELSAYGIRIRLEKANEPPDTEPMHDSSDYTAVPLVQRFDPDSWSTGRAGMQYRDLIPDRLGGRVIASHIRIPDGGPVPDYVHHHSIQFQMIYCRKGWVRVVYEDQGLPIVMRSGDCVLQPPHIRHRVLECSDGLEVIEVSAPAEHETLVDHELGLPTPAENENRDFDGQRFVFHSSAATDWSPSPLNGFEARDTGIAAATSGRASASTIRSTRSATEPSSSHKTCFGFVLNGSAVLVCGDESRWSLAEGDAFLIPANQPFTLKEVSGELFFADFKLDT